MYATTVSRIPVLNDNIIQTPIGKVSSSRLWVPLNEIQCHAGRHDVLLQHHRGHPSQGGPGHMLQLQSVASDVLTRQRAHAAVTVEGSVMAPLGSQSLLAKTFTDN